MAQPTRKRYGRKKQNRNKGRILLALLIYLILVIVICLKFGPTLHLRKGAEEQKNVENTEILLDTEKVAMTEATSEEEITTEAEEDIITEPETTEEETTEVVTTEAETEPALPASEQVYWSDDWTYAENSKVHQESVTLYHADPSVRKGKTIAINAGHGSRSAAQVSTLCHPDGSAKVTGGSTAAGAKTATGANGGMTFQDGASENSVNLKLAIITKEHLLAAGYDVLMLREESDCDLDNIARSLYANNYADCHIALHYDSTSSDKGLFYIGVPNEGGYRSMEPVASHWESHERLGGSLIEGADIMGIDLYGDGRMALDLTQTSYSTVPSVDLEVGDSASDYSDEVQSQIAKAICEGLDIFFQLEE